MASFHSERLVNCASDQEKVKRVVWRNPLRLIMFANGSGVIPRPFEVCGSALRDRPVSARAHVDCLVEDPQRGFGSLCGLGLGRLRHSIREDQQELVKRSFDGLLFGRSQSRW